MVLKHGATGSICHRNPPSSAMYERPEPIQDVPTLSWNAEGGALRSPTGMGHPLGHGMAAPEMKIRILLYSEEESVMQTQYVSVTRCSIPLNITSIRFQTGDRRTDVLRLLATIEPSMPRDHKTSYRRRKGVRKKTTVNQPQRLDFQSLCLALRHLRLLC